MPTKRRGWVRKLLKRGEAKVIRREPFTIQLLYETGDVVQECTLGVDVGSKVVGVAVVGNNQVLYQSQKALRDDVKKKMDTRRMYRKTRRNKKTRYRKPRFLNRGNSTKKDRIPPSIKSKIHGHIREIELCKSIMPITKLVFEVGAFDTHLLKRQDEPFNRSWGYQKGPNYGYENRKQYIRARDKCTCQLCGDKQAKNKKVELEVHHIRPKNQGGTDHETNLITLCKSCHDKVHSGELTINKKTRKTLGLKYAAHMNIICSQLCKKYSEAQKTYGYITKLNRELLGLPKSHCNDACVIASGGLPVKPSKEVYCKKEVCCCDRILTRGKRSEKRIPVGKILGIRKFDKVKYLGNIYFVRGRMSSGYCTLMDINGVQQKFEDPKTVKIESLERIGARRGVLCHLRTIHPLT